MSGRKDEKEKCAFSYNEQNENCAHRKFDSDRGNDAQYTGFTDRTNLLHSFVKISKELPIGSTMGNNNDDTVGRKENDESLIAKYDEKSFVGKNVSINNETVLHSESELPDNAKSSAVQFPCETCGKKFNSMSKLKIHRKRLHRHEEKIFLCFTCNEKFSSKKSLHVHQKVEHAIVVLYKCDICNKELTTLNILKKHRMEQHGKNTLPNQFNAFLKNLSEIFECNECDKKFAGSSNLLNHKRMAHRLTAVDLTTYCTICCQQVPNKNLARHKKTVKHKEAEAQMRNLAENLRCNECDEKFSIESNLQLHKKVAHGVTRDLVFYCNLCDKNISNKHNFARHKQSLQHKEAKAQRKSSSKNLKRNECDQMFDQKLNLLNHKKTAHRTTEDLTYCNICGIHYSQYNLSRHKKTMKHKNAEAQTMKSIEKQKGKRLDKKRTDQIIGENFVCGTCDGKFYDFNLLLRHVQAVHLRVGRKFYLCNDCGMDFDTKLRLEVHWLAVHIKQENFIMSECF